MRQLQIALLTIVVSSGGCGGGPRSNSSDSRLPVFAGVPPLAYVVEQIGGQYVKVDALVQPGQDPHTFEPTPQQVLGLAKAALFFKIDMPFENVLLEKVQKGNPQLRVVDATVGIKKRAGDVQCSGESGNDEHGHEHEHASHAGEPDPHIWLSPPLLKILANNITAALCENDPLHAQEYRENLATLVDRVESMHQRITKKLTPHRGRAFYVFHPGFGYFADAYGLRQVAVESSGREPSFKQLQALIDTARRDGAKTVFVQPQTAQRSAEIVAQEIGGKVVVINGLAADVLDDIDDIAAKVEAAFAESTPQQGTAMPNVESQMTNQ